MRKILLTASLLTVLGTNAFGENKEITINDFKKVTNKNILKINKYIEDNNLENIIYKKILKQSLKNIKNTHLNYKKFSIDYGKEKKLLKELDKQTDGYDKSILWDKVIKRLEKSGFTVQLKIKARTFSGFLSW